MLIIKNLCRSSFHPIIRRQALSNSTIVPISLCQKPTKINLIRYQFSSSKPSDNGEKDKTKQPDLSSNPKPQTTTTQQQAQASFTQQEKRSISAHQVDDFWNALMQKPDNHNFQKQLILTRKSFERSTKELRSAILFEDLLNSNIKILVYDTKGKVFLQWLLKTLFSIAIVCGSLWTLYSLAKNDEKQKVILEKTQFGKTVKIMVYVLCAFLSYRSLLKYIRFQRRYVEKIVYNTEDQNFTFVRRNFFGFRRQQQISRYKLVYTENTFLNKKGTNYFHLDTKEEYGIAYRYAWAKEDLFSHLIAQRIKI